MESSPIPLRARSALPPRMATGGCSHPEVSWVTVSVSDFVVVLLVPTPGRAATISQIAGLLSGATRSCPTGLALCKIHHAAYDVNIIAGRPDYLVEIRHDILHEIDGPMLRHGLPEMHGAAIHVPRPPDQRPDRARLEFRYEQFLAAA